jgi:hypothetical protein
MTNHDAGAWHREVIPTSTDATLRALRDAGIVDRFYLAGGMGLALQFGHRLSIDLDFFAKEQFDEDRLLQRVQGLGEFSLVAKAPYTLHATLGPTKISFLGYAYPMLFSTGSFEGVAVAAPREIACMKLTAIASRGTKRDFVDLYLCARQFGLQELLHLFGRKYAEARYSKPHLLKSLVYFADAEKDPMPQMLVPLEWDAVKLFFIREAPRIL